MVKKLSAATALFVVFAFLLVSTVHACSGLGPIGAIVRQSPMSGGMTGQGPCGQSKQEEDICKSVRDSILSTQPSVYKADVSQQPVLPIQFSIESEGPTQVGFSPLFPAIERAFHPVFKLPLTFSYLVLRI
jgi:hypothetical protein